MSIWQRIIEQWQELSWDSLFGPEQPGTGIMMSQVEGKPRPAATKQVGFTIAVIALAAKMAKADGAVTQSEVAAFHRVFSVAPEERANVDFFFDMARRSSAGAESYARQIMRLLDGERSVLEDLMGSLFEIARADGRFAPEEDAYLRRIASIFGFTQAEYDCLRADHLGCPEKGVRKIGEDDPHEILGLPQVAEVGAIRERWRALVKEHHPERAMALGLQPEFIKISNDRLARINDAYRRLTPTAETGPV